MIGLARASVLWLDLMGGGGGLFVNKPPNWRSLLHS